MHHVSSTDSRGEPLYIINSANETAEHLLKMEYIKVLFSFTWTIFFNKVYALILQMFNSRSVLILQIFLFMVKG